MCLDAIRPHKIDFLFLVLGIFQNWAREGGFFFFFFPVEAAFLHLLAAHLRTSMDVQYEQWMQESAHFIFIVFTSYTEDKLVHEGDAADVAVNCWSIAKKKKYI